MNPYATAAHYRSALEAERAERRRERLADFVLSTLIAAQMPGGGAQAPDEETVRDLVRAARWAFAEIDSPTKPKPEERGAAPREPVVDNWQEGLWLDEDEPAPDP